MRFDIPPKREDYETQEQFEEMRAYWQRTAGRNHAIREQLERNRAKAAEQQKSDENTEN